jgi:hypothetical protein
VESALRSWRDRHPEFAAIAPEIRAAADPTTYLRDLWTATGYIDIRGLAVGSEKAHRFPIEALYVALSTAEAGRGGTARRRKVSRNRAALRWRVS